jgi:hypothetical protein
MSHVCFILHCDLPVKLLKVLFLEAPLMPEAYFDKHITICNQNGQLSIGYTCVSYGNVLLFSQHSSNEKSRTDTA